MVPEETKYPPGHFELLESDAVGDQEPQQLDCYVHNYDGAEWHVPEGFEFPRNVKIENGWKLWLRGMPSHQIKGEDDKLFEAPIRPFRYLEQKHLPKAAKN